MCCQHPPPIVCNDEGVEGTVAHTCHHEVAVPTTGVPTATQSTVARATMHYVCLHRRIQRAIATAIQRAIATVLVKEVAWPLKRMARPQAMSYAHMKLRL